MISRLEMILSFKNERQKEKGRKNIIFTEENWKPMKNNTFDVSFEFLDFHQLWLIFRGKYLSRLYYFQFEK